jgi:hypothetical protein
MARVAVDPAILSHGWIFVGRRRQLLVLFGATKLRRLVDQPDLELMQQLARGVQGAEVHGGVALRREPIVAFLNSIAADMPTDLELVGSRPLFDLVTAEVETECRREPDLYEKVINGRIEPFAMDYAAVPPTVEALEDPVEQTLHAAVYGHCDVIVSDALARRYPGRGRLSADDRVFQLTSFEDFIRLFVERNGVELARIDPQLMAPLARLLQSIHPNRARL